MPSLKYSFTVGMKGEVFGRLILPKVISAVSRHRAMGLV
jgi:hypothetical protein